MPENGCAEVNAGRVMHFCDGTASRRVPDL
jgi:hypothetical protein